MEINSYPADLLDLFSKSFSPMVNKGLASPSTQKIFPCVIACYAFIFEISVSTYWEKEKERERERERRGGCVRKRKKNKKEKRKRE